MNTGTVFYDKNFVFHDGEVGKKLFVVLGSSANRFVVVKTTSQQHGRGVQYGCQPNDRFHNFFLPHKSCGLDDSSWVCLDEFYELNGAEAIRKAIAGDIRQICTLPQHIRLIQDCALLSLDLSEDHAEILRASLV